MMKIKQTILVFALLVGIGGLLVGPIASAASCGTDANGNPIETSVVDCSSVTKGNNGVEKLLFLIIDILTAGVGVAAVGGVIYASILYASAGDSSEQTKKAISIIINVAIGLVAYALMYVFLNFIIPGGKF